MTAPAKDQAIVLLASELPAACPNKKMPVWNSHPRVYLDFSHARDAHCPYCGSHYRLEGEIKGGH
jgi:uncharacterized Zn-finger protein